MEKIIHSIIEKSVHKEIPKGTILLKAGEVCKNFVYLKSGITRHFLLDMNGNEITKNFSMGSCFLLYSLSSFLTQSPSEIQCQALNDLEVYELDGKYFNKMKEIPEFLELWSNILVNFVCKKEKKEISLLKDDSAQRYLSFLQDYPNLINKIPHYYIASYLSVSPETLSRIRKKIY